MSFPPNFVFQAGLARIGETEGWNVQDTEAGWPYLAAVLDLFNREIIGWSIKPRMIIM